MVSLIPFTLMNTVHEAKRTRYKKGADIKRAIPRDRVGYTLAQGFAKKISLPVMRVEYLQPNVKKEKEHTQIGSAIRIAPGPRASSLGPVVGRRTFPCSGASRTSTGHFHRVEGLRNALVLGLALVQ